MFTVLSARRLLFEATFDRLVDLAVRYEYAGVDPSVHLLSSLTEGERGGVTEAVREAGLAWGVGTLPIRVGEGSDGDFADRLAGFRSLAPLLSEVGVTTLGTWFAPAGDVLPYGENFRLHVDRLNQLGQILEEHRLRLALEYVGPSTWRRGKRYEFVHDMGGMRELIGATQRPAAFGLLVDAFHWYTAGDTVADILALDSGEVLGVDLDDAPTGVPVAEQQDLERAQPGSTGVIDTAGLVGALRRIGYDGPVMAEPFSTALAAQREEDRVRDARAGLRRALAG